jgi:hypothetical protein
VFETRKHQVPEFQVDVFGYVFVKIGYNLYQCSLCADAFANRDAVIFLIRRIDVQILIDHNRLP